MQDIVGLYWDFRSDRTEGTYKYPFSVVLWAYNL